MPAPWPTACCTGEIESTFTPQNCLDVLAQQIVAMVALEDWECAAALPPGAPGLWLPEAPAAGLSGRAGHADRPLPQRRLPRAAPAHRLGSGARHRSPPCPAAACWPSATAAPSPTAACSTSISPTARRFWAPWMKSSSTRRAWAMSLPWAAGTWRAARIEEDKIIVSDAAGTIPRMPFWRGDAPRREYDMGLRLGAFRRELLEARGRPAPFPGVTLSLLHMIQLRCERIRSSPRPLRMPPAHRPRRARDRTGDPLAGREYAMDQHSARNAILYVRQQWEVMGAISSDKTVIVELFNDALGDQRMAIHSCFGGRVNSAWALVLANALRDRYRHAGRGAGQRRRHPLPLRPGRPRPARWISCARWAPTRRASGCWWSCPARRSLARSSA